QAQLANAEQQVSDLQADAQQSAANERMIALLKSEKLRQIRLNNLDNGNALEEIAAALANAARAQGDLNAQNELQIAQIKAAALIVNAQAQSTLLHRIADVISGTQSEINMANAGHRRGTKRRGAGRRRAGCHQRCHRYRRGGERDP